VTTIDEGLLSPVTVGHGEIVSDARVLDALVTAEVALARAYATIGLAAPEVVRGLEAALGWQGPFEGCRGHGLDAGLLAESAVAGGNPVIPLVALLKAKAPAGARVWVHRGATSQDILDTALMIVARRAAAQVGASLAATATALESLAREHRDEVAAARTLTQHAVPTTVGLRATMWLRAVRRAHVRLGEAAAALPAQLGGAGGTLASFAEIVGAGSDVGGGVQDLVQDQVQSLVRAYAADAGLVAPDAPWHVTRWPVTELGDALVQTVDALGKIAADVATLSRTEIGELAEGAGGGSSAMPQKQNPAASVLIRSAAIRAPQLGATLHLASALAVDERPDGAWHAEWPTLRELLRLALGASAHAASLVAGLRVDVDAVARNLAATGGLIVAERLSVVLGRLLGPVLGKDRVGAIVAAASSGGDLATLVREAIADTDAAGLDVAALVDPAAYTGLAGVIVDGAVDGDAVSGVDAGAGAGVVSGVSGDVSGVVEETR